MGQYEVGQILSADLTVENAEEIRDFYASVVGWHTSDMDMGGYADYFMTSPNGEPRAGVCHARGVNADLPPQWIIYVIVEDLDRSLEACRAGGGSLIGDIRGAEHGSRFCIIRDPAGAVMGLMENPPAGSE
jgi:uncharacterized protein